MLYNDGISAKDFTDLQVRKFRSDLVSTIDLDLPTAVGNIPSAIHAISIYLNASEGSLNIRFSADTSEAYRSLIADASGRLVYERDATAQAGVNVVSADLSMLPKGMYYSFMALYYVIIRSCC